MYVRKGVRRSWPRYRSAFLNFEIAKLAHTAPAALLRRPGALRNRKKVAALVANAQEFECIRAEHGTFARYLRTVKSKKDACTILQERFRHVGPYTAEFYLHCVGRSLYGA
jgi:3-methyladenine DNA glycosylase Tag